MHAQILITEFMADNASTLQDQFGEYSDWVELCNTSSVPVNLEGWVVADKSSKSNTDAFTFPSHLLQPSAYIVVFASGTERKVVGETFHTKFKLSKGGESLFLFSPSFSTAIQSITFGTQYTDFSYGVINPFRNRVIITNSTPFKVALPQDPVSWDGWAGNITNSVTYSETGWRNATGSIGALGAWTEVPELSLRFNFTAANTTNIVSEGPSGTSYTGTFNTAIASWQASVTDNQSVTRAGVMRFNGAENVAGFRVAQARAMGLSNTIVTFAFWMRSAGRVAGGRGGPECLVDVRSHVSYKSGNTIGLDSTGRVVCQPRVQDVATGATLTNTCAYVVNDGAWHHVAIVQDQRVTGTMTFYIDGIFCGSTPTSLAWYFDSRIPVTLGGLTNSESGHWHGFNGDLDDFHIYPRALSEAEVGQVMRNETQPGGTRAMRVIAQDALALYYPFTNAPVNNVITDVSGNNYIATNSAATWSGAITDGMATVRSGVMTFNANKIRIPTSTSTTPLLYSQKGTIMFWMRSSVVGTGTGNEAAMLVDRRANGISTPIHGFIISQNTSGNIFIQAGVSGTPPQFNSTKNVTDSYWHHIAVTYDQTASGYIRLFIDGTEDSSSLATAVWYWTSGLAIELGQSHDGFWKKFKGDMDDFRIYSRALSSAEITTIAANTERPLIESDLSTPLPLPIADNTFFARYSFTVVQPSSCKILTVNTRFQDGFTLFLNGVPKNAWNSPEPEDLDRFSIATGACSIFNPSFPIEIGLTTNLLRQGVNTLAFQVLRQSGVQADIFLSIAASLTEVDSGDLITGYMQTPSPGQENPISSLITGPLVTSLAHTPKVPAAGQSVTVTVQTTDFALATAASAMLYYRRGFESETNYPMTCISNTPPTRTWQATIPAASLPTPENFWRYYVKITDSAGGIARYPAYGAPLTEPEYQGSITAPVALESTLPVFRLFVSAANLTGMDIQYSGTGLGARCAVFYNDTLYDNVRIDVRGNTTATFKKKSHSLKFNSGYALDYSPDMPKIRRTSFIAEYPDPSYVRQSMSFWLLRQAGMTAPFHYPVHLRLNGAFYELAFHSDRISDEMTERFGYDPLGDLYKCVGCFRPDFFSTGGFEKIAPDAWTANMGNGEIICSNYFNFAKAIQPSVAAAQRRINLLDQMDWSSLINYMAVAHLVQESDNVWANFCTYFDSRYTRRWKAIAYDMNLSWGTYYEPSSTGEYGANDTIKSHPLYGGAVVTGGNYNYLFDAIFADAELRSIYLRRLRTLMDTIYQSNDVPFSSRIIEAEISRLTNSMAVDAIADRARWGWPGSGTANWVWGTQQPSIFQGVQMLYDGFLTPHRNHYFGTHCVTNTAKPIGYGITYNAGIPSAQPENIVIRFGSYEVCPASCNQEQEYLAFSNTNSTPADISGWQLKGGVTYTFPPATVIPAATSPASPGRLILASSFQGFDSRTNSPKRGEGRYVVAGYAGKLSLRGETLSLVNTRGVTVDTLLTPVAPSLAQQYLRIAEIMYNPPVSQDREFIKLVNISSTTNVPLKSVAFTEGIIYTFPTNTPALAPGASVILAKDASTFASLYGFTPRHVFSGSLDSAGELLRLLDAVGEKVQDVEYRDWYVSANGLGASIMAKDLLTTPYNGFSIASAWYPSALENGAPGAATNPPPFSSTVIVNELLAHTDLPDVDTIELYNGGDTAVDISGWHLSDKITGLTRFCIPNGTLIPSKGYKTFTALDWSSAFEFNSEGGEGAYLSSATTNGFLTGYCHGFEYFATPNGVTLGRHITSEGKEYFPMQAAPSLGTANTGPWVGPLIISQIDWHAPSPFIEITNVGLRGTPSPVGTPYWAITQPDGSILLDNVRLEGDITYSFPAGSRIALNERLVITSSQYTGTISTNGTKEIRLLMPDTQNLDGTIPLCLAEALSLKTTTPWPTTAGNTNALHRRTQRFAADPTAWFAAAPCPGQESNAEKVTILILR
jgi:spore coat protein CotH